MTSSKARGVALITVLILLSMMSALTLLLMMNLLEEARASSTLERNLQLFYYADGGIEEARARLLYGSASQLPNLPAVPTANWAGYLRADANVNILGLDPAYNGYASTSVATALGTPPYVLVKIFYNTEANKNRDIDGVAGLDATTVVYLGPDGSGNLTRNLTGNGVPIRTIQAYATLNGRQELVEAEIVPAFIISPAIGAVVRTNGDVTLQGNISVNGIDGTAGVTVDGVRAADSSPPSPGPPNQMFFPPAPNDMVGSVSPDYDVASYVAAASAAFTPITEMATPTVIQSDLYRFNAFAVGSDANPALMYSDRSVTINGNNNSSYGILIVDGDVNLSNLAFYGLIICSGDFDVGGGGSVHNLYGAAIAGGDFEGGGSYELALDMTRISNYLQSIRTKVITFREVRR